MIPSIYVAGASGELERAKKWIAALGDEGFRVTHDWTKAVEKFGSAGPDLTSQQLRQFARYDLRGVQEANIFWLLAPTTCNTIGGWIEMGYAMRERSGGKIIISPQISKKVIFAHLATKEFSSDERAFEWIQNVSI